MLPAAAWQAVMGQDGAVQRDKHAAEIAHLLGGTGNSPAPQKAPRCDHLGAHRRFSRQ